MTTTNPTRNTIAKVLFFVCLFLMGLVCAANAQNAKQTTDGNYIAIKDTATRKTAAKATGKTYTDAKGNTYPVMISKNGKLFIIRTSQTTGRNYNQYLKLD
jgi:hypothetical protein